MSLAFQTGSTACRSFIACLAFSTTVCAAGVAKTSAEDLKINNSSCTVQFAVQDDRFVVARFVQWRLSPRFRRLYAGFKGAGGNLEREHEVEEKLKEELRGSLNRALALELPLSIWAQGDAAVAQRAKARGKSPRDTLTWQEAESRFKPRNSGFSLADMILNLVGEPSIVTVNHLFDCCVINDPPLRKFTTG